MTHGVSRGETDTTDELPMQQRVTVAPRPTQAILHEPQSDCGPCSVCRGAYTTASGHPTTEIVVRDETRTDKALH